jgi:hypothetical protein
MAKAKKKIKPEKPTKKRADKYDEKLQINGSFEDLVKALVTPKNSIKKK